MYGAYRAGGMDAAGDGAVTSQSSHYMQGLCVTPSSFLRVMRNQCLSRETGVITFSFSHFSLPVKEAQLKPAQSERELGWLF